MAYRRSNTMYDAMMSGIAGLGEVADSINGAKKQASDLKLHAAQLKESEQNQTLNKQKIDVNKETMAQALARKQLLGSLEDGGAMTPGATAGTGPGNNVNMDEIKAAKKFDQEAKLWNSMNQDREGFVPVTGKKLKEMAESRGLEGNKADQKGVAADELQSQFSKDATLSDTEKAFYANKPEAYGERLKPMGVTYLPGADGFVTAPSRMVPGSAPAAPATRVKDETGKPVVPRAPASEKSLAQIEAEAKARAEGAAAGSEGKPLSGDAAKLSGFVSTLKTQAGLLKTMIQNEGIRKVVAQYKLGNPKYVNLIQDVADAKGRLRSGGAVNKDESDRFAQPFTGAGNLLFGDDEAALAAIDGALAEAEKVESGMRTGAPAAAAGAGVDKRAMAEQALNDPEATEEEKAAARRILGK